MATVVLIKRGQVTAPPSLETEVDREVRAFFKGVVTWDRLSELAQHIVTRRVREVLR